MTIKRMFAKHPDKLVLAVPKLKDATTSFAKSWTVLQTVSNVPDCEKALAYYEDEGYSDVVPISTFLDNGNIQVPEIPTRFVAKFWRVYLGLEGGG